MKKIVGTVITVCIVLLLIALCIAFRGADFDENQISTLKILLIIRKSSLKI